MVVPAAATLVLTSSRTASTKCMGAVRHLSGCTYENVADRMTNTDA